MATEGAVYICPRCGQKVMVVTAGVGALVCCNVPMERKEAVGQDTSGPPRPQ